MPKKKRGKKGKGDDDDYDALFDDQVRLRAQISCHLCVPPRGNSGASREFLGGFFCIFLKQKLDHENRKIFQSPPNNAPWGGAA